MSNIIRLFPARAPVIRKKAEPRTVKPIRKKGVRPPTPSYGEDILVIDSDGKRHPPTVCREMIAALVLAELLKRDDIRMDRKPPLGPYRNRRQTWNHMTDRMIMAAIVETPTIIFCKHGRRHMAGKKYQTERSVGIRLDATADKYRAHYFDLRFHRWAADIWQVETRKGRGEKARNCL